MPLYKTKSINSPSLLQQAFPPKPYPFKKTSRPLKKKPNKRRHSTGPFCLHESSSREWQQWVFSTSVTAVLRSSICCHRKPNWKIRRQPCKLKTLCGALGTRRPNEAIPYLDSSSWAGRQGSHGRTQREFPESRLDRQGDSQQHLQQHGHRVRSVILPRVQLYLYIHSFLQQHGHRVRSVIVTPAISIYT